MTTDNVWVIDDDQSIRWVLERAFSQASIPAQVFASADDALQSLPNTKPLAILTDVRMPGTDGIQFLRRVHDLYPELPVVIMTAHSDLNSAVESLQSGAFEYLPKPFDVDDALAIVERAIRHQDPYPDPSAPSVGNTPEIIGQAPAMQEVFRAIGRLANSNVTVLINGASGSGKELVARALHRHSPRASGPFIPLNMAAIPKDLVESELFGHEKGAFTGANSRRIGRFEQAHLGTLFLDEIGDMPAETQTRLLRVLSDGEFYRVGAHSPNSVNVRIVAATHQNLEQLVQSGKFREDLFHRLNVIRIRVPDLRERRDDIAILARHFLTQAAVELGSDETKILLPETEEFLADLPWPGNVRQLENTCRWLTVMAPGREIAPVDLPPELQDSDALIASDSWEEVLRAWATSQLKKGGEPLLNTALPTFERIMIESALAHTNGRKREASELLGWGRNTLTRKLSELKIST